MKLTPQQEYILKRAIVCDTFIVLVTRSDDRIAKNLAEKGLGHFTDFGSNYSWRPRHGYINHFTPNRAGLELRAKLLGVEIT